VASIVILQATMEIVILDCGHLFAGDMPAGTALG